MANQLQQFVATLTSDPHMWADFRTDPRGVMQRAGLSEEEITLFTEGPYDQLLKALGRDSAVFSCFVVNPT